MTKFPVLPLAPSRNILIALSSGQGMQPWLMGLTEVAYGLPSSAFAFLHSQGQSATSGQVRLMPGHPSGADIGRCIHMCLSPVTS